MGYNGYQVCPCGAWTWTSDITHTPHCTCGRRWKGAKRVRKPRAQEEGSQAPRSPLMQGICKAISKNWETIGEGTQAALLQVGFKAPPKEEEVDPLLKALQDHKDALPEKVRMAFDNHAGQSLPAVEEGDQSSKDLVSASQQCRILTKKKIALQDKVTAAKESLRKQLLELQELDEQIKTAQRKVESCQSKLSQSMSGLGENGADGELAETIALRKFAELAEKLGINLTPEQSQKLRQEQEKAVREPVLAPPGLGVVQAKLPANQPPEKEDEAMTQEGQARVRSRTPPKK